MNYYYYLTWYYCHHSYHSRYIIIYPNRESCDGYISFLNFKGLRWRLASTLAEKRCRTSYDFIRRTTKANNTTPDGATDEVAGRRAKVVAFWALAGSAAAGEEVPIFFRRYETRLLCVNRPRYTTSYILCDLIASYSRLINIIILLYLICRLNK